MKKILNGVIGLYTFFALFAPPVYFYKKDMSFMEFIIFFLFIGLAIGSYFTIANNWKNKEDND